MNAPSRFRCLLSLCLALAVPAWASGPDTAAVEDEFRMALLRLVQSGALPDSESPLVIDRPAERVSDFGLLVDRDSADGLVVLGTLPGGSAARLGLQAGDRLVEANGIGLRGEGGSRRMRELLDDPEGDGRIELSIVRAGQTQQIAGTLEAIMLPAMRLELDLQGTTGGQRQRVEGDPASRCGRLSVEAIAPRTRELFPARLIAVDGGLPGTSQQDVVRLAPGKHVVRVAELIDETYFSGIANRQRGRQRNGGYKDLDVEIEAGVTYFLAARFHRDRSDRILDGSYWEPVLWKERAESCR